MAIETNEYGEQVEVVTLPSGHVIKTLKRDPLPLSKDEKNAPIIAAIAAIDGGGQARAVREFLLSSDLTGDKAGLQALDDKIKALRAKLEK